MTTTSPPPDPTIRIPVQHTTADSAVPASVRGSPGETVQRLPMLTAWQELRSGVLSPGTTTTSLIRPPIPNRRQAAKNTDPRSGASTALAAHSIARSWSRSTPSSAVTAEQWRISHFTRQRRYTTRTRLPTSDAARASASPTGAGKTLPCITTTMLPTPFSKGRPPSAPLEPCAQSRSRACSKSCPTVRRCSMQKTPSSS